MQFLLWTFSLAVSPPLWNQKWVDFGGGNILVFRGWGADKPGICQAVRGWQINPKVEFWKKNLTWLVGFNDFWFSSPFGEMIQFDWYFSDGVKPPTIVTCWTQKLVLCVDVSPFPLGVNQPFVFRGRVSWILLDLFKLMFYGFDTMVNHHFSPTFGELCFDMFSNRLKKALLSSTGEFSKIEPMVSKNILFISTPKITWADDLYFDLRIFFQTGWQSKNHQPTHPSFTTLKGFFSPPPTTGWNLRGLTFDRLRYIKVSPMTNSWDEQYIYLPCYMNGWFFMVKSEGKYTMVPWMGYEILVKIFIANLIYNYTSTCSTPKRLNKSWIFVCRIGDSEVVQNILRWSSR